MGMTMSQKILAAHAGLDSVKAGQLIEAKLDMVLGNDITSPVAINVFEENGATSVFDNSKTALIEILKDLQKASKTRIGLEDVNALSKFQFYNLVNSNEK